MDDLSPIEDLLDEWEEWREQNPQLPLDQFVAAHCSDRTSDVIAAFLANAAKLSEIDTQLRMLGDAPATKAQGQAEKRSSGLTLSDLVQGCEPIAGYTLVSRLGGGGFGEVWKAVGPGAIHVALKFVPVNSRVGQIEERSLDVMRDVRHPHLLSVFGTWRIENLLIIATELADRTLLDRFHEAQKEGYEGIPPGELLRYMEEAAKGIDYLNGPATPGRQRIQHRDIKPQNLLLSGGSVKVGDFGLARSLQFEATSHTGSLTLAYAAPECFDGSTSHRSDQYSLAVTYCYLRGGRLPFEGTHVEIIEGHRKKPPDLSMLPDCERPAVAKALKKLPKDRWATCMEWVQALSSAGQGKSMTLTRTTTSTPKNRRMTWVIVIGLLFLVTGSGIGLIVHLVCGQLITGNQDERVTLAVMDFDNHSRDPSLEGFRLGFRDMLVTDLSRVNSIRVLERAQLAALLKEHQLAVTPFIDPQFAVKLGRGLSARVMLSGSFVISGDAIRIDVRMVNVESSEVLLAEAVEGTKADLFGLQRALARQVLKGLKMTLSDPEREALELPQTREFNAFRLYSDARLAQMKGQRNEAERHFRESLSKDPSFLLASRELDRMESEALARLSEEQKSREVSAGEIGKRLQDHWQSHQQIIENEEIGPRYFASLIILSAHAGLLGDHDRERQLLSAYWRRFIENVPPERALTIVEHVRSIVVREGKFFQEHVDSGEYPLIFDNRTPITTYLKPELRHSFSWPKWSAIWPFNKQMRRALSLIPLDGKTDSERIEGHIVTYKYPDAYLEFLLQSYDFANDDRDGYAESLKLNMSVWQYYLKFANKPTPLLEKLYKIEINLLSHLKRIRPEEWDAPFLRQSVVVLEILGKTATRGEDRDLANGMIVRFTQQLRVNEGLSNPNDAQKTMSEFCSLKISGSPLIFVWHISGILGGLDSHRINDDVQVALSDVVRGLPESTTFNILWVGKHAKSDSAALFDNARPATATAKKEALAALRAGRFGGFDERPLVETIERLIRDLGPEATVVIITLGGEAEIPASTIQSASDNKDRPKFFALASTPTKSLAELVAITGGRGVQIKYTGPFGGENEILPFDVSRMTKE